MKNTLLQPATYATTRFPVPSNRPSKDIGTWSEFRANLGIAGEKSDWGPTVVSPFKEESCVAVFFAWFHLVLWVVTVVIVGINGFGVQWLHAKSNECTRTMETCFHFAPHDTTVVIGYISFTFLGLAVLGILAISCLVSHKEEVALTWAQGEAYQFIFVFNLISLASTLWLFVIASEKTATWAFYMSCISLGIHTFATCLLYSSCMALKVTNLHRVAATSMASSLSLLVAIGVSTNEISLGYEWNTGDPIPFSVGQKMISYLVPGLLITSVAVDFARLVFKNCAEPPQADTWPFTYSIVLFAHLLACFCSLYTHAFVSKDIDMASGMFSMASFAFTLVATLCAFAPSPRVG